MSAQQWEEGEFMWTVTLQWSDGRGVATATRLGTINRLPGETRYLLTNRLVTEVKRMVNSPSDAVILFMSLERNEL